MEDASHERTRRDLQAESEGLGSSGSANPASCEGQTQQLTPRRGIPEFSELVLACRHHLLLTAFVGIVISSTLAVLSWQLTIAPYEAESLVRVRQHQDVVFTPQTPRADDAAFVRAQEQLVLCPQVLAAALNDKQVQSLSQHIPTHDAVDWLRGLLRVDIQAGAEMMSISVLHPSPRLSHALCAAVTRAYLDEIIGRATADRQRRQEELERAAREADRRLDELWAQLNDVARAIGSDTSQSLTIRDEIQLQAYREYAQQLRVAQLRGNELQSLLTDEQLRIANEEETSDEAIQELLLNHPDVVAARNRIATIDSQIQQLREVIVRDDSPRLQRLAEDRQVFVADLEKLMSDLRPQLLAQSREQHRIKMESDLVQLRKQIELNQSEKEFLHSRMEEIDTTIIRTDEKNGVKLEMSRHTVDRQTRLADSLSQALEEFKIESQSQPRVTLLEQPQLPSHADRGRQVKAAAGAAGVGWLIAIISVGCFEWRSCRVRHADDVRSHSARPVFGTLSDSGEPARDQVNGSASGTHEAAARLMLANKNGRTIPSLMVSSALAGEPRHLVSLDLARAFKDFRRRTLLIDADTSGHHLSQQLGADHLPGLIQVCSDQLDPRQYIVPSSEEGLDFLPLGRSQGASLWIDPQAFCLVLGSLRDDYDAIVVNGPAMLSSAEGLLLASHVDETLLTVFAGTSRWNQLAATEQLAVQAGIALFGSVLHTGKCSATWNLSFDRPDRSRQPLETEESTEHSLRESIAAMQRELNQSTPRGVELPTEPVWNRESTS